MCPCQNEAPLLESTWQRVQNQGVVFIGVNHQDIQADALKFLQQYAITYPNVVDLAGATAINYGVTGVPETFFFDGRGIIVNWVPGESTAQNLQSNIQVIARSVSN